MDAPKNCSSNETAELRRRAEEIIREKAAKSPADAIAPSPDEMQRALHELQVHQIELEMQNEELRRTQSALEDSRTRYFELYDLAPVSYLTLNVNNLIQEANLTAAILLGMERSALVKQPLSRFIFPDDQDMYYHQRKQLIAAGAPRSFELRMIRRNGESFWAHIEAAAAQNADGEPLYRAVISNITLRKMVEEQVGERTEELESANASLAQAAEQLRRMAEELAQTEERERKKLAVTLHDNLQQILVAAMIRMDALKRFTTSDEHTKTLREVLDLIGKAITTSRSLAVDLCPPVLREGGIMPGLHWLARWMKANCDLTVEVTDKEIPKIPESLSLLLFQAVRELLLNIVKHSGVDQAAVTIDEPVAGTLRVVVSDQGRGFPEKYSENFGLFHLKERLTFVGGELRVDSKPRQDTRVSIVVPYPLSPEPSSVASPVQSAARHFPLSEEMPDIRRLLVVDDHSVVRQGLAELLDSEPDFEVIGVAANGEEAVHLARSLRPDVILMDISMPVMNGIEATRIITKELPQTQVIGLSMHEHGEMSAGISEAGAATYLQKDGPMEDLIAAIRALPLCAKPAPNQAD